MSQSRYSGEQSEAGASVGRAQDTGTTRGAASGSITSGAVAYNSTTSEYGSAGAAVGAATAPARAGATRAKDYGHQAKEYLSARASAIIYRLQDLRHKDYGEISEDVIGYTRQNPGQALLVSAAAGFVIGFLIRNAWPDVVTAPLPAKNRTYAPAIVSPMSELMPVREYIVSKPTSSLLSSEKFSNQLKSLNNIPGLRIVDSLGEDDTKVVLLTDEEVKNLRAKVPGLVIEPDIVFNFGRHPLLGNFNIINPSPSHNTKTIRVRVVQKGTGRPVPNVPVYLVFEISSTGVRTGSRGFTGQQGVCNFTVPKSASRFREIIVDPEAGYWNKRLAGVSIKSELTVHLDPLPCSQTALYDWGHDFAEMRDDLPHKGDGITIGIIDSGVSNTHQALSIAGGDNCVRTEEGTPWYEDRIGHGTHCAGIIAATLGHGRGVKGYVPRAKILAYNVVPKKKNLPLGSAVLRAIQQAMNDGCDIISMSFNSRQTLTEISARLETAYENGVFCVSAVGNAADDVEFPASLPSVMGVGAFGKQGVYPSDSLHTEYESQKRSRDGQYFLANFSNSGENLDFCAPGVAIVSTVPGGDYGAKDGTSTACPQVAGIAGLALAAHREIFEANRDSTRVDDLVTILKDRSKPLGFGPRYEGAGSLKIGSLLKP